MASTSSFTPWFQYIKPNHQARLRLFCFPYAGGSASIYRLWREQLPPEIEIYPIQLPGRENRIGETPFSQLPLLVRALSQAIQPHLTMPFAFFGHSMGSLIGFELARELRRKRMPTPLHLLISARCAPQLPDPDPPIHHLPDPEFMEEIRRLEGTPEEVLRNTDLMQIILPVLRGDFSVCETYIYTHEAPLTCPITAFGGWQDHETSKDELEAWSKQTQGFFRLHMFEGGHFFLHSQREQLLQSIAQSLLPLLRLTA